MSGGAGVKVFCRFRPFNKREIELGADKAVDFKVSASAARPLSACLSFCLRVWLRVWLRVLVGGAG